MVPLGESCGGCGGLVQSSALRNKAGSGPELMEALGLQSRSVTWHHPRWGEKAAGLRLGDMMRKKIVSNRIVAWQLCCTELRCHEVCANYSQTHPPQFRLHHLTFVTTSAEHPQTAGYLTTRQLKTNPAPQSNISLSTFLASPLKIPIYDQLTPTGKQECLGSLGAILGVMLI